MIWTIVEIGMATTASSLATLKPFFRKFRFRPTLRSLCSCAASCCCTAAASGYAGLPEDHPRHRSPESSATKSSTIGSITVAKETAVSMPIPARGGTRTGPWTMPSAKNLSNWYGGGSNETYEDIELAMPLKPLLPSPERPQVSPLPAPRVLLPAANLPPSPAHSRTSLSTIYEQVAVRRASSQASSSSADWKRNGRVLGSGPDTSWLGVQAKARPASEVATVI